MYCAAQNACSTVREKKRSALQSALRSVDHKAIVPVLLQHADLAFDERVAKIARSSCDRQAHVGVALAVARSCQFVHQNAEESAPATRVIDRSSRQARGARDADATCL